MSHKFEVGDKVRCVKASGQLVKDRVYTVREVYQTNGSKDYIKVFSPENFASDGWWPERFELAVASEDVVQWMEDQIHFLNNTLSSVLDENSRLRSDNRHYEYRISQLEKENAEIRQCIAELEEETESERQKITCCGSPK